MLRAAAAPAPAPIDFAPQHIADMLAKSAGVLGDLAEMHGREEACDRKLREAHQLYERIGQPATRVASLGGSPPSPRTEPARQPVTAPISAG